MKKQFIALFVLFLMISSLAVVCIFQKAKSLELENERGLYIARQTTVKSNQVLSAETTHPKLICMGKFKITAYCPCEKCCGKWAKNRPTDKNGQAIVYTSSGAEAKQGVTVSVDPGVIPIGTKILINGHEYIAQDTGSKVKGNVIDIYFDNHEDAVKFGCKKLDVFIVKE